VEVFPKLVRDLGRDQGKEVELVMRGTGIEIDKRILDELKDPLIHLVRNCVDHGIEKPEARLRQGKAGRGAITLTFSAKDSRQVEILICDDGAGIDLERVRAAAVRAGIISAETAGKLDPQESLALIFQSGISGDRTREGGENRRQCVGGHPRRDRHNLQPANADEAVHLPRRIGTCSPASVCPTVRPR
jgi:two-component system chemotaxis sensor kinase CheA